MHETTDLAFIKRTISASSVSPQGELLDQPVEVRIHPLSGRSSRIALSRSKEREPGTEALPDPPPGAYQTQDCPFCPHNVQAKTPKLRPDQFPADRMTCGSSILFPNLYPYGSSSAVSLIDEQHFVEIGTASAVSYRNSFVNCSRYLDRVLQTDPYAIYTAVTQNHLPSAGGSLIHPHLQVQADRVPSNQHRFLLERAEAFWERSNRLLLSEYFRLEKESGERWIGRTGEWSWLAAFAPEGFFEIWGLLPNAFSLRSVSEGQWSDLARGVCRVQRLYRSLNRNGYNLGLLSVESAQSFLELRIVLLVRSNYAPWVRSDYTGFEVMLGDMATFTAPEDLAAQARPFFAESGG